MISSGVSGAQSKVETFAPIDAGFEFVTWYPAAFEFGVTAEGGATPVAICALPTALPDEIFADGFDGPA